MDNNSINRFFFITGAESTGKSTLTEELAKQFGGIGIPEYARTYLESINRHYNYADVESIARRQIELIYQNRKNPIVFFDTCLINLKVWFREVYNDVPGWLEEEIPRAGQGIYLLCEPDLPWQYDPLRENPHRREYLSEQYEQELNAAGFTYFRVFGKGEERVQNAIEIINRVLIC
ncbi:MAG: ATP-binding protein [Bacteroidales bacterium]